MYGCMCIWEKVYFYMCVYKMQIALLDVGLASIHSFWSMGQKLSNIFSTTCIEYINVVPGSKLVKPTQKFLKV